MKYIASCSGGKDSVATLILAKEHGEPLDEVVYCEVMYDKDTSGEFPEHRDFIYEKLKPFVENELNVPFRILRSEKTYLDFYFAEVCRGQNKGKLRGFPVPNMCGINRDSKTPPIRKYWQAMGEDVVQYIGIAADEPIRLKRLKSDKEISLLNKYGYTEAMAVQLCEKYNLLSPIYAIANRNGCWFCFNNSDRQWRHLMDNHCELIDRLLELEQHENKSRECLTRTETPSQLFGRLSRKKAGE